MSELREQIKKVDSWKWYLDQKPKWLAERLQRKFDVKVTSAKLRAVRRKMKKEGVWEKAPEATTA